MRKIIHLAVPAGLVIGQTVEAYESSFDATAAACRLAGEQLDKAFSTVSVELQPDKAITENTAINGWSVQDIIDVIAQSGYEPVTVEKAHEILQTVIRKMDASIGINWTVIEAHIDFIAQSEKWKKRDDGTATSAPG